MLVKSGGRDIDVYCIILHAFLYHWNFMFKNEFF